jgi:hypothetical protein
VPAVHAARGTGAVSLRDLNNRRPEERSRPWVEQVDHARLEGSV